MAQISVAICCSNAQDTLEKACQSVQWAAERVIVDSGSTDQTPVIAQRYADQYHVEPWRGYTRQKQYAASLCTHDWVLVLDSDEEVSPQLAQTLQNLTNEEMDCCDLFWIKRQNYVLGRHVRAWDPDWQSRLIHRQRVHWIDHPLHEGRRGSTPSREGRLQGPLYHKRTAGFRFEDYFGGQRLDQRLVPVAKEMLKRGKYCHPWDLLLRPWFAFFKFYFLKQGFRDGSFGLMMAQKAAVSTQLKYAALWYVQYYENPDLPLKMIPDAFPPQETSRDISPATPRERSTRTSSQKPTHPPALPQIPLENAPTSSEHHLNLLPSAEPAIEPDADDAEASDK